MTGVAIVSILVMVVFVLVYTNDDPVFDEFWNREDWENR